MATVVRLKTPPITTDQTVKRFTTTLHTAIGSGLVDITTVDDGMAVFQLAIANTIAVPTIMAVAEVSEVEEVVFMAVVVMEDIGEPKVYMAM
jgi:hypothetical protein